MLEKKEVKTILERFLCDSCKIEMKKSDIVLLSHPPQYQYTCPKCKNTSTSYDSYPKISYEDLV